MRLLGGKQVSRSTLFPGEREHRTTSEEDIDESSSLPE
jgi:hypothetical protein